MTILEAIAALGGIPAVYLTGRALSARAGVAAAPDRWALAPAIGLAVWTVPMLLAALFGFYRPWLFGLVGWLLSVVLARRIPWRKEFRTIHLSSVDLLAVAVRGDVASQFHRCPPEN